MPRTVNAAAYAARSDTILDAAETEMAAQGYDEATIADVVKTAGISKGAFYHYFSSKPDLLEALVQRRLRRWEDTMRAGADGEGSPSQRLQRTLQALGAAKADDRPFFVDALRTVYSEQQARMRLKLRDAAAVRFTPIIARLVDQGTVTGDFSVSDKAGVANVVVSLLQECSDRISRLLLAIADGRSTVTDLERQAAAYVDAVHRVLGAMPGTLDFLDSADLHAWAEAARSTAAASQEQGE